jgi:uncharacterized membrane protein YgdD (TMEM256/DUF423 family)
MNDRVNYPWWSNVSVRMKGYSEADSCPSRIERERMPNIFVLLGAINAAISVAAGAFGAHGLKAVLSPDMLAVFETASRYQMYHGLALVVVGLIGTRARARPPVLAGWCFVAGIVLFSGSLYVLALSGVRWLGAVTPLGGAAFLAGWIALAWSAWTDRA